MKFALASSELRAVFDAAHRYMTGESSIQELNSRISSARTLASAGCRFSCVVCPRVSALLPNHLSQRTASDGRRPATFSQELPLVLPRVMSGSVAKTVTRAQTRRWCRSVFGKAPPWVACSLIKPQTTSESSEYLSRLAFPRYSRDSDWRRCACSSLENRG